MIDEVQAIRKWGRILAGGWPALWTIIYMAIISLLFWMTLDSVSLGSSRSLGHFLIYLFVCLCAPFSMLASLYLMWLSYIRALYTKMVIYSFIPLVILYFTFCNLNAIGSFCMSHR